MLANYKIHSTIPAHDLDRAKQYYADKLGLTPTREMAGGLVYEYNGAWFLLKWLTICCKQHIRPRRGQPWSKTRKIALRRCGR